jgi:hypothetical protein
MLPLLQADNGQNSFKHFVKAFWPYVAATSPQAKGSRLYTSAGVPIMTTLKMCPSNE